MKIKKIILISLLPLLLSSCGNVKHEVKANPIEFVDNYLYQVNYEDYDYAKAYQYLKDHPRNLNVEGFGCSSVRNGNFYGRSFDFTYNEMCEFLVKNSSKCAKYKNMGVAILDCNTTKQEIESGLSDEKLAVLPFSLVDGINEKGVVCNTNVVPVQDIQQPTTGTNPGKKEVFYQFLPRYVLDNAGSAKEAVELIKNEINVTNTSGDLFGLSAHNYELHLMVADAEDTFIVEFVNNKVRVLQNYVMTNYYLSLPYTPHSAGIERFEVLSQYYDEGKTLEGMASLMERVKYTNLTDVTHGIENNVGWFTEMAKGTLTIYEAREIYLRFPKQVEKVLAQAHAIYTSGDRTGRTYDVELDLGGEKLTVSISAPWQSVHMGVYDIANRSLRLTVQQNYNKPFMFTL